MPSRVERASTPSRPLTGRLIVWLVLGWLLLAVTASAAAAAGRPVAIAQGLSQPGLALPESVAILQDTPAAPAETEGPPAEDTPQPPVETQGPPAEDTPQPPDETTEPAPSDTAEPPPEPTQPPVETSEPGVETPAIEPTPDETPLPEETAQPIPTEPTAARATATPTATRAVLVWPTDWPLGTIEIGDQPAPPTEPIRLTGTEWLQLALLLGIVALVAILGGRLLYRLFQSTVRRRHLPVDETLLAELRPLLSWWLAAIGFHLGVWLIDFESQRTRELFADLTFFAYLGVATLTAWRLVDRAIDLYTRRIATEGQAASLQRLGPLMRRWARGLILVLSGFIALGRLDIGLSVPVLLVGLIGLTISLAARDTLTDVIAGFFILVDQPFRIGDRIEVEGIDTWAEVVNIGLRSSVLLTRHNVEIVVPNSKIGKNQVINYSYPDPHYRMQTHVGIAFGTDVERARRVMIEAVRQAEFVLPDEPVDALYVEIGDGAMIFRVRWWIDFRGDWERAYDRIHTALHNALAEAGIDSPYPSQSLNLEVDDQTLAMTRQAWQEEGGS